MARPYEIVDRSPCQAGKKSEHAFPARKALAGPHPARCQALQHLRIRFTPFYQADKLADGNIHARANSCAGVQVFRNVDLVVRRGSKSNDLDIGIDQDVRHLQASLRTRLEFQTGISMPWTDMHHRIAVNAFPNVNGRDT